MSEHVPLSASRDASEPDLDLLVALEALLQENNVTKAAARLGISQPAASARLNRLRQIFDDPLFVPASHGRGVVPTPRAIELKESLSDALAILRGMMRGPSGFDPQTSRRTFVIAMQEQPAAILAPQLARAVLAEAPALRLALIYPAGDLLERLEDGTVDLLIAPPSRGNDQLMSRSLVDDELLTAQRKGHPRGRAELDLDSFCALDHLLVSTDGGGFSGLIDQSLAASGRHRRVALSIQSYGLAPLIVAGSDVVCTLPSRLLRPFADDVDLFSPPLELPKHRLSAMWHARNQGDPGHIWLREHLYKAVAETLSNVL